MLISKGFPPLGGVKHGGVGKKYFEAKCVNISKTVGDSFKVTITINRKLHMRFRLASRSMTLDNLELYKSNFQRILRDFTYLGGNIS